MGKFEDVKEIVKDMVAEDKDRDLMFEGIDDMFRNKWNLPKQLRIRQWIRKVTSTDAHDQIRAATRILSNLKETIRFNPYSDALDDKNKANIIEKALKWNYVNSSKRRRSAIRRDIVMSAIKYDAVFMQTVYLPYQYKIAGMDEDRKKLIDRFGPFVVNIFNPHNCHVRFSNYMPEEIVVIHKKKKKDIIDEWGKAASKLKSNTKIDDGDELIVADYTNTTTRGVWCYENDMMDDNFTIIDPSKDEGKHKIPFLSWVARVGGTTLEDDPAHQYIPLLYAAYNAKQWITQNIIETLAMSQAIAKSDSNKLAFGGPGADDVYVDWTEPSQNITLPPGVNVTQLQQSPLDKQLLDLAQFLQQALDKSGVSRMLQGGNLPPGTSFATYSLVSQASLGSVTPYKELAELAISDMLTQFLQWCHFQGKTLEGYGLETGRYGDIGVKYTVTPQDYKPEDICIEVELNPDLPTDKNQRINGAVMSVERLGVSQEEVLEQLGYPDPQRIQKEKFMEQLQAAMAQAEIQRVLTPPKLDEAAALQQIQIDAQKQLQAGAPAQQVPPQAPSGPNAQQMPPPGGPQGLPPQLQGEGMNPAEGGSAPQEFAPEATFEGQTGESRTVA
jgi:hypothetical protein